MNINYLMNTGYTTEPAVPTMPVVEQPMQPQAVYNPMLYYQNPYPFPFATYHTFGQFVETQNENQTQYVDGLSIDTLKDKSYVAPTSVGFNNTLIEPSTTTQAQEQADPTPIAFNNLVTPVVNPIQQKFALQPIPEDADRSMLPKPVSLADAAINDINAHLNKNNQLNQTVGKKINNWFTRLLDQKGQDYISSGKLTIDEVSKNAERILDDMIAGKIDYDKQGQYLINPNIINTLINYCSNKLAINRAIQLALGYIYNDFTNRFNINDPERLTTLSIIDDSQSRNITQAIAIVNQDIGIYDILYQKLLYVESTKNASSLFSLTNDLSNFKKQIKKRY